MAMNVIKCSMEPTKIHETRMLSTLGICCDIYNHLVFESRIAYKEGDDKIRHDEMSRIVPCLTEGKEIYSKVAQPVVDKFFRNLSVMNGLRKKGFKVGKLRYKSKERYRSFRYNQSGFKLLEDGKYLPQAVKDR